jgi:acetyl esterase/lipase
MQRALVQTWRKASLLVDSLEVRHSLLWPVTLQGTMNLNRVSLGCSFAHLPFPTKWMTGRGRWNLVRMLSKTSQINKHAPLQNETMTERFRGRWTNAVWLVSWINDFAELSQPAEGSPLACPLLFGTHRNLPPAYIQTCCLDPFCDTAIIYEHLLRAAGSPTNLDVYLGLPHGFWAPFSYVKGYEEMGG